MFRDRPLTWLFIIATVCVDLAMILPMLHSPNVARGHIPSLIFLFGVPAQLSLVAVWAAAGNSHRLARGAVLTLAVFLAALTATQFDGSLWSWKSYLAFYMSHTVLVCGGALPLNVVGWLRRWPSFALRENRKFQFSVIEMFGWTSIAAIWAFAGRHARTEENNVYFLGLILANSVTVPLVMVALLNCSSGRWYGKFLVLLGYVVAILMAMFAQGRIDLDSGIFLLILNLTQATFLTLWYAVQRLDDEWKLSPDNLE